jgi:omega-6 fatty acid desaturase (delta-12 desaturase)
MNRFHVLYFFIHKYVNIPSIPQLLAEQLFNNIGVAATLYMYYQLGILPHFLVSNFVMFSIGTILFFNQHTYNPPYITDSDSWSMRDSGLKGSSFIQIPWYLKYFTGGIEYHHIHHYNSKIPNYNLRTLHDEVVSTSNAFDTIVTLSMEDCYKNLWLSVYDEAANRFITFAEADERIMKNE